jgi:hypothetical protein
MCVDKEVERHLFLPAHAIGYHLIQNFLVFPGSNQGGKHFTPHPEDPNIPRSHIGDRLNPEFAEPTPGQKGDQVDKIGVDPTRNWVGGQTILISIYP